MHSFVRYAFLLLFDYTSLNFFCFTVQHFISFVFTVVHFILIFLLHLTSFDYTSLFEMKLRTKSSTVNQCSNEVTYGYREVKVM